VGSRKLNIAVIFLGEREVGGGFQYQLSSILELKALQDKYNFVFLTFDPENKKFLNELGINKTYIIRSGLIDKIIRLINRQEWFFYLSHKIKLKSKIEKNLEEHKIDLVYFPNPSGYSLNLLVHNYVITVWDTCHRDMPEFPEVNFFREFERRELLYTRCLKKAVAVVVDSETSKFKLTKRYGLDEERIYVVSFQPSFNLLNNKEIDVKSKYKIEGKYIYYPAQFWSHKNHIYIIDALRILKDRGIKITAVFSGSDRGNLRYVLEYAKEQGVDDLVRYIGFAPDEEIYSLYKNSLALVMPTYFGPTNIPPLEAFYVGVPVIYSDLPGLKEQVGDAALLCDLKNPNSLAEILQKLIDDENLRLELVRRGKERLEALSKVKLADVLDKIFEDYEIKRKCWK
jgi:glycosyltransferase involved in cell wall biosynthesis